MAEKLTRDDDYDDLPDDAESCFVEFERRIHRRMLEFLDEENHSSEYYQGIKSQYLTTVYNVGLACGISNIPNPPIFDRSNNFYAFFNVFELAVQGEVARIRIGRRHARNSESVLLEVNTKSKIKHYIDRLLTIVEASEIESSRRIKLKGHLHDFMLELDKPRLGFSRSLIFLSSIALGISAFGANVTVIASDGQNAITQILKLIGHDKDSEDEANIRLTPPPKALLPPKENTGSYSTRETAHAPSDLDDEFPF